jgi:hypothetical protein
MARQRQDSEELAALRGAILAGDRARAACTLAGLIVFAGIMTLCAGAMGEFSARLAVPGYVFLGFVVVYETGMLALIRRALRFGKDLPRWVVLANVAVESTLATAGLVISAAYREGDPRLALSGPTVLLYFYIFAAASLRMTPIINAISALVATLGYAGVGLYVHLSAGAAPADVWIVSPVVHGTCGGMILAGGVLGCFVAARIRRYVVTGIRQAAARERMERDLEIARSIQQGLLPADRPEVPGFDVAGETVPADQTGGDYFGWFAVADGKHLVTIADVTGHGIGPALLTSNLHAYLQTLALDGAGLADWVTRLNGHMTRDLREGRFVTFAAAVIAPGRNAIEVLSAGHGPILVYGAAEDRVAEWKAQGPPLGVVSTFLFGEPKRHDLRPGDSMVFLTDGFSEWARADSEQYGIERLKESLRRHHALGAAEIVKALRREVETFASGSKQADDLTVVVVKRTGETAPGSGHRSS